MTHPTFWHGSSSSKVRWPSNKVSVLAPRCFDLFRHCSDLTSFLRRCSSSLDMLSPVCFRLQYGFKIGIPGSVSLFFYPSILFFNFLKKNLVQDYRFILVTFGFACYYGFILYCVGLIDMFAQQNCSVVVSLVRFSDLGIMEATALHGSYCSSYSFPTRCLIY